MKALSTFEVSQMTFESPGSQPRLATSIRLPVPLQPPRLNLDPQAKHGIGTKNRPKKNTHTKANIARKGCVFSSVVFFLLSDSPRLNIMCRRFVKLYGGEVYSCPHHLRRWNSVPKRRHINFRRRGIIQKKEQKHSRHGASLKSKFLFLSVKACCQGLLLHQVTGVLVRSPLKMGCLFPFSPASFSNARSHGI